jgi:molybdopterin synthase catalytic subunit
MIELTRQPIDVPEVLRRSGAVVLFLGTTREFTGSRQTSSLDYQGYPEMATRKLTELEQRARRQWPLLEVAVVHRLGHLEVGEASVAIAVSSAHREDAFQAGKWLIDTIKKVVPIWKKENWADGTSQWVHPGVELVSGDEAS